MTNTTVDATISRQAWLGLLTVLGPVLLVSMDGSVLYLAMPRISSAITPSADQALWILDIYGFVVGSLLITFGNIGDRFGRLRLIIAGAILFGIGSTGAAFATDPESLIAFRALMGLGGATLLPSGLAIVAALFPDPRERAQAIGIFAATFATGFAIGPMVGGFLLRSFQWWGVVFLINVPVVIAFIIAAPITLKEVRSSRYGRIDILSLFLSFAGILLFTYSVKRAAAYGVSSDQVLAGLAGVLALGWFIRRQGILQYPLMDLTLFRDRVFTVAISAGLLSLVVWSAAGYMTGLYLQLVLRYDVLTTALLTLPGAAVLTATCIFTPYRRAHRQTRGPDRHLPADQRGGGAASVRHRRAGRCGVHCLDHHRGAGIWHFVQPGRGGRRVRRAGRARGRGERHRRNQQRTWQRSRHFAARIGGGPGVSSPWTRCCGNAERDP